MAIAGKIERQSPEGSKVKHLARDSLQHSSGFLLHSSMLKAVHSMML
jgi:hypothetical protein